GLPLTVGDRFIVRDTGRQLVVGGGWVVDPAPGRSRRALQTVAGVEPAEEPDRVATRLLVGRRLDRLQRLSAHSGGGRPQGAVIIGDLAVESGKMDELESVAVSLVEEEHSRHPLRPGLPMATLAARLRIEAEIVEELVERAERLERRGPDVALAEHEPVLSEQQEAAWVKARERLLPSLAVPGSDELGVDPDVLHLKIRTGELIRISDDLLYLPSQIEDLLSHMSELGEDFTVAEFRDAAGLSRKYAVPILEWADKEGLTFRRGDTRSLR
ncbi:MAG TPA: SelB C-terminal domain-containing protein, partial [Acidimicrobiia bacterium]|nr:SelB C-terminal domain-containing protein [Acidimicrobiia bacterium]